MNQQIVALLRQNSLFETLTDNELAKVVPACSLEQVARRTTLFKEGDPATHLYIIVEGELVLERTVPSHSLLGGTRQTIVRPFGAGQSVAPQSMTADAYTSSAVTSRSSSVIKVDTAKLRLILNANPRLGYKFMTQLAQRIALGTKFLEEALIKERDMYIEEVHKRAAHH